jgi:hypothetical protein
MATVGGFSRHKNLVELTEPDITGKSVAVRQAAARTNLGITADVTELNAAADYVADLTATAAEINAVADNSARTTIVPAGGAAVVLPAGGGVVLVPLVTANVTATLPAATTAGMQYKFVFIGSAADAEDWVITSPSLFLGGPAHFDVGGTSAVVYANGTTHNTLTVNNPAGGTEITFIADGTNWAVTGMVSSADAHAFSAV